MLGMGAVGAGDLAMIMGSSRLATLPCPPNRYWAAACSAAIPMPSSKASTRSKAARLRPGSIIDWYRQHFAGNETAEAARLGKHVYEILDAKAAAVRPGCDGLICLDYWQGNRCPRKDPLARGAFWGLTLAHSPAIFRSIYEATAFGTRHIIEDLAKHGYQVKRLFAGGGERPQPAVAADPRRRLGNTRYKSRPTAKPVA